MNCRAEAAEIVRQSLLRDGVSLLCCGKQLQISRTDPVSDPDAPSVLVAERAGKRLTVDSHGEQYDLAVDEILVGAGRAPNVEGLGLDAAGTIDRVALRSQACAIGQAAAAIFARAAPGRSAEDIRAADEALTTWLAGEGGLPDWPGLETIAAARDYPARHGAIRLAWQAARGMLPSGRMPS